MVLWLCTRSQSKQPICCIVFYAVEPLDIAFKGLGFWLFSVFVCHHGVLVLSFYRLSTIELKIASQMHG